MILEHQGNAFRRTCSQSWSVMEPRQMKNAVLVVASQSMTTCICNTGPKSVSPFTALNCRAR